MAVPHFAFPLTYEGGTFVKVEQDSQEDLNKSILVLLLTPLGSRLELPQYGVPDLQSAQMPYQTAPILAALSRWEPRAQVLLESSPDVLDEKIQHLLARIGASA